MADQPDQTALADDDHQPTSPIEHQLKALGDVTDELHSSGKWLSETGIASGFATAGLAAASLLSPALATITTPLASVAAGISVLSSQQRWADCLPSRS